MTPSQPFALRLFVPSGIPEGMRIVEKRSTHSSSRATVLGRNRDWPDSISWRAACRCDSVAGSAACSATK